MTLTRDQILAKRNDLARQPVNVPELGGEVLIRELTLKEVREINKLQKLMVNEPVGIYPKLVAMACIDENGNPLFVGEDLKLIDELPWAATNRIAEAVLKFSKMAGEENENGVPKE